MHSSLSLSNLYLVLSLKLEYITACPKLQPVKRESRRRRKENIDSKLSERERDREREVESFFFSFANSLPIFSGGAFACRKKEFEFWMTTLFLVFVVSSSCKVYTADIEFFLESWSGPCIPPSFQGFFILFYLYHVMLLRFMQFLSCYGCAFPRICGADWILRFVVDIFIGMKKVDWILFARFYMPSIKIMQHYIFLRFFTLIDKTVLFLCSFLETYDLFACFSSKKFMDMILEKMLLTNGLMIVILTETFFWDRDYIQSDLSFENMRLIPIILLMFPAHRISSR